MTCFASLPNTTGGGNTPWILQTRIDEAIYKTQMTFPSTASIFSDQGGQTSGNTSETQPSRRLSTWNPYALPLETTQIARHTRSRCSSTRVIRSVMVVQETTVSGTATASFRARSHTGDDLSVFATKTNYLIQCVRAPNCSCCANLP